MSQHVPRVHVWVSRSHHGPMWGSRSLPKAGACVKVLPNPTLGQIHALVSSRCYKELGIPTIIFRISKYIK